jgi:hypothetical protein
MRKIPLVGQASAALIEARGRSRAEQSSPMPGTDEEGGHAEQLAKVQSASALGCARRMRTVGDQTRRTSGPWQMAALLWAAAQ